jgi:hypothetical protein
MTDLTKEIDDYLATQGLRRAYDEPGWYVPVPCGKNVTRKVWATDAPYYDDPHSGNAPYSWADIEIKCDGMFDDIEIVDISPGRLDESLELHGLLTHDDYERILAGFTTGYSPPVCIRLYDANDQLIPFDGCRCTCDDCPHRPAKR